MSYTARGVIHAILPTEQRTANFQSRALILRTADEQYPQLIKFEFTQTRCDVLDAYQVGQAVTVHFDLRGREWISPDNGPMYFTTLNGWKIKAVTESLSSAEPEPATLDATEPAEEEDDLPF